MEHFKALFTHVMCTSPCQCINRSLEILTSCNLQVFFSHKLEVLRRKVACSVAFTKLVRILFEIKHAQKRSFVLLLVFSFHWFVLIDDATTREKEEKFFFFLNKPYQDFARFLVKCKVCFKHPRMCNNELYRPANILSLITFTLHCRNV